MVEGRILNRCSLSSSADRLKFEAVFNVPNASSTLGTISVGQSSGVLHILIAEEGRSTRSTNLWIRVR